MSISGIGTAGCPMAGYETKRTKNNVPENQFMDTLVERESVDKNTFLQRELTRMYMPLKNPV